MNITTAKNTAGIEQVFTTASPNALEALGKLNGLIIFALALGLRVWFNFLYPHPNTSTACDGWEYLTNAGSLLHLLQLPATFWGDFLACLTNSASVSVRQSVLAEMQPLSGLSISGPTFPSFLALSYLSVGAKFDPSNWMIPVAAQSLISALTSLMTALLATRVWNRKVGIIAGLLAAIYPGFIVNSGRLITETLAAFLVTLSLWLAARSITLNRRNHLEMLLLGASCGVVQLTRPVLTLLSLCIVPSVLARTTWRHKLLASLFCSAGLLLVLGPWVCWQTVATGHPSLLVDRLGTYNYFIGNDPFTGGWLSAPLQMLDSIRNKGLGQVVVESVMSNPVDFSRRALDKISRLFELPLNDFRVAIGPFTPGAQALLHQVLLVLSGIGITLSLFLGSAYKSPERTQVVCRLLILWAILIHFAYLPFNSLARYALPAMPLVVAFAAAGVFELAQLARSASSRRQFCLLAAASLLFLCVLKSNFIPVLASMLGPDKVTVCLILSCAIKTLSLLVLTGSLWICIEKLQGNKKFAKCTAVLLALFVLIPSCLQLRAHGRWQEWQHTLSEPGDKAVETIQLNSALCNELSGRQCYLLVDADGWQSFFKSASIRVNGEQLKSPIIPGISLPDCIFWYADEAGGKVTRHYEQIFRALALGTGISLADIRQWFLLPLPSTAFKQQDLRIEIEQSGTTPIKLFGTYPTKSTVLQIPNVYNYSWEKAFYGVENDKGLSDSRIDSAISRTTCPPQRIDLSTESGLQCGNYNIRLLASPVAQSTTNQFLRSIYCSTPSPNETVVSGLESHHICLENLPKETSTLAWQIPEQLWLVRISGRVKAESTGCLPSTGVTIESKDKDGNSHTYNSPWIPVVRDNISQWVPFDFAFPLNTRAFPGELSSIDIHCHAIDPAIASISPVLPRNLKAKFADLKLEIFTMPSLPTAQGYKVY